MPVGCFELFTAAPTPESDYRWRWRLIGPDRDIVRVSEAAFRDETAAREDAQALRDAAAGAQIRFVADDDGDGGGPIVGGAG